MLEAIVDFINLKLQLLNYFEKRHCLSTLVKTDKGTVYPAEYVSKGNYNAIDFDAFDGVSYIRLTNDIAFDRIDNKYTPSPRLNITFPLRVVFSVRKDKLSADDAYSFDRVRASIAKQLESDPLDLTTQLKADNVVITTGDYIEDGKTLWDEETAETGQYQPKYEVVFGALEVTVTVTIKKECIPAECDNFESDILRTFDFCKPAIQDRLTPTQVACLEAWLVQCDDATVQLNGTTIGTIPSGDTESFDVLQNGSPVGSWNGSAWIVPETPCDDATVTLNGVTMTTIPAGDTENIQVRQSSGATLVGSKQGQYWRIDDSAISINGSPVADVKAEDSLDIDVTQDGSPVGSWNGSAWIVPPCSSASLAITFYSDAGLTTPITTADFAQTVYIKAVATGVTPSGYVLKYPDRNGEYIETPSQVSDTFTHEAVNIGAGVYSIIADGTVVGSATLTTTIDLPIVNGKAVYGFYKMVDSYAGDCVRVRRFSDNTEQDFGFDNQILDIDAIRTFAGDEGFAVTKVYNQLGNGDITQPTASSQPGIQQLDHALFAPLYRNGVTFNASLTSGYDSGEQSTDHLVFSSNIAATANSRVMVGTPINRRGIAIGFDGNNVPRIVTQPSGIGGTDPVYIQNPTQFVMEQKTTSQNLWVDNNLEITASGTYTLDAITGYQYFRQDTGFTLPNGANWFAHVSYENDKIDAIENILQKLLT